MAPELRRTRHETSNSSQQDMRETKTPTYGTRSSKRKASEINNFDSSPLGSKASFNSSQSSVDETEPISPPAKRTRKSSIAAPQTPEEEEVVQESVEVPLVTVDEATPAASEDEEEATLEAPVTPKRGGYRRRGRGGGRWGHLYRSRGGARGGSSAVSRSTPAAESSPSQPKGIRGRGGHRVKKSDNARIQALYHRRAALKHQYKQVAYFQKAALISMAEKSLEAAKADPNYHKTFDEYGKVTQGLNDIYKKRFNQLNEEYELKKDFLIRLSKKNQIYEASRYQAAVDEVEEQIDAKIIEKVNHVYRQWANGGSIDKTPYYRAKEDKVVRKILRPAPIVHSIATPYNVLMAEPKDLDEFERYQLARDLRNFLEQHPMDHWDSMTRQQQESFVSKLRKAALGDKSKGSKIRNTKSSALYQPQAESLEAPNPLPDLVSAAPTPGEVSGEDTETDTTESIGEEQPTDQFGVKIPKKPTPRNGEIPQNRIVSEMPIKFDDDEIGIRKHVYRKTNKNDQTYLGMDMDPNPKRAHWDQVARGHNSAKNKKEDLDQDIVRTFGLHPTYGLPIKGAINPDFDEVDNPSFDPPTNWKEKLAPTQPLVLIEETPGTADELDEDKLAFRTSRSEWLMRLKDEEDEMMSKFQMSTVLRDIGELDRPEPPVVVLRKGKEKQKVIEPEPEPENIDESLLRAVDDARKQMLTEGLKAPHYTPQRPPPMPPSSARYDPVRDIMQSDNVQPYRTPYQPVAAAFPPPPPPPPPVSREDNAGLFMLANMAEQQQAPLQPQPQPQQPQPQQPLPIPIVHKSPYQPPRAHWPLMANAPPAYAPAPAGPPSSYPFNSNSFNPINGPYASPRAGHAPPPALQQPTQGSYRELRPAPPQNKAPPPPPPAYTTWTATNQPNRY